ncbi:MAG: hypothetical protein ABIW94_10000 [Gemmatimonadaceae bacterium]
MRRRSTESPLTVTTPCSRGSVRTLTTLDVSCDATSTSGIKKPEATTEAARVCCKDWKGRIMNGWGGRLSSGDAETITVRLAAG